MHDHPRQQGRGPMMRRYSECHARLPTGSRGPARVSASLRRMTRPGRLMRRATAGRGSGRRWAILVTVLSAVSGIAGCGTASSAGGASTTPPPVTSSLEPTTLSPTSASQSAPPPRSSSNCPTVVAGFDCDFQQRFATVQAYVATRPGVVGVVVHDRQTGAVWRTGATDTAMWTESTIKLAMTVDLFLRDRAGKIRL